MKKIKTVMKITLSLAVVVVLSLAVLTSCGTKKSFVGTFGGTASNGTKVEIVINEDNTVTYAEGSVIYEGTWSKHGDNSIELDFNGQVSSSEPLIVTLSSDGNMITVDATRSGWTPDYYQRR